MRTIFPRFAFAPTAPARPLDQVLCTVLMTGLALVALLPAARGQHALLGWLPLWLVAMPAMAWWALHRFRLPGWPRAVVPAPARPRRPVAQARRRRHPKTDRRLWAA